MQQCSASPHEMDSSLQSDRRTPDTSFDSPQNSPTQNQLSDGGRRRDNSGGNTNSHGERLVSSPGSSWRVSYTGEQRTRSATMASSPDGSPSSRQLKPLHHSRMKAKSMVQVVVPTTSVPPQGRCMVGNAKPRRGVGNSGGSISTTYSAMRYGSFNPASAAGCVSPPLHASPSHHRPGGYIQAAPPAMSSEHSGIVSLVRNPSGSLSPRSSPTPPESESEGTPHPTPATAAAASSWNLRSPQDACMPPPLYAVLAHSHHRDPTSDAGTPCTPTDQIAHGVGNGSGFHEHFGDTISSAGTSFCTPTLTGRSPHPRGSTSMPHPMPSSWVSPGGSTQLFNASFGARRRSSEHSSGSFWSPHPLCFPSPMRRPDSSYSIFTDDLEASTCGQPPPFPLALDDDAATRVRIMWAEGAWGGTTHSSSGSLAPQSSGGPPPSTDVQPTQPLVGRQRTANPHCPRKGAYPWSFSSSVFHETSACDTALATAAGSQVAAAPATAQPGFDIEAVDVHSDAGSSHSSTNAHHAPAQGDDAVGDSVLLAEDDGCHIQTTPLHRQDDWICAGTLHAIETRRFAKHSPR